MGRNLGPLNIKDSYEGLVQISGSQLTDGSGSLIPSLEVTASYALTASYAQTSTSASHALVADLATTASYVESVVSASYAVSSSHSEISDFAFTATSASHADISDFAFSATSASFATTALLATSASHAVLSDTASFAITASYAENAGASTLQEVLDNSNVATGVDIILTGSYLRHSASFSGNVIDNLTTPTASEAINHIVYLTQAEYSALPTPDSNTLYVISGSSVVGAIPLQEVLDAGSTATGSIDLLGAITASAGLLGNASTATSASYALTASYLEGGVSPFPYTGSAEISGSLAVTNVGSTAANISLKGGYIHVNSDSYNEFAGLEVGHGNTLNKPAGNTNTIFGTGNNNGSANGGFVHGENNTINSPSYGSVIMGSNGGTISATFAGLFAGQSNQTLGNSSVVLGGENNIVNSQMSAILAGTGSSIVSNAVRSVVIGGENNDITNTNANTYNAAIIGGQQNDIVGTVESRDSIVAAGYNNQINNYRFGGIVAGENNVLSGGYGGAIIGAGSSTNSSAKGAIAGGQGNTLGGGFNFIGGGTSNIVSSGNNHFIGGGQSNQISGNYNVVLAGNGNNMNGGTYSGIFAGSSNIFNGGNDAGVVILGGGSNNISANGVQNTFILGGSSNAIRNFSGGGGDAANGYPREIYGGIIGGRSNRIGRTGTGTSNSGANGTPIIIGGYDNQIGATTISGGAFTSWNTILNSSGSQTDSGSLQGVIGGALNYISGSNNAYIIASNASTIDSHNNSVIIGGSALSTSKDNEVVVPNLTISGSVTAGVYTLADAAGTTTMDCRKSNFFTLTMPAGGSTTLTPTNIQAGQTINVKITQNATPSTIAFSAAVEFEGGTAFAVSTGAGEVDVMTFISFDGTTLQATGLKNFS